MASLGTIILAVKAIPTEAFFYVPSFPRTSKLDHAIRKLHWAISPSPSFSSNHTFGVSPQ